MKMHQREERKKQQNISSVASFLSLLKKKNEVRRVKHIKEAHPEKQFKLTLIEEYVGVREGSSFRKSQKITAKRAILSCSAKKALPLSIPEPPKPHNGHTLRNLRLLLEPKGQRRLNCKRRRGRMEPRPRLTINETKTESELIHCVDL